MMDIGDMYARNRSNYTRYATKQSPIIISLCSWLGAVVGYSNCTAVRRRVGSTVALVGFYFPSISVFLPLG